MICRLEVRASPLGTQEAGISIMAEMSPGRCSYVLNDGVLNLATELNPPGSLREWQQLSAQAGRLTPQADNLLPLQAAFERHSPGRP